MTKEEVESQVRALFPILLEEALEKRERRLLDPRYRALELSDPLDEIIIHHIERHEAQKHDD